MEKPMPEAATTITPLLFEGEHMVRTVDIGGETWFVGLDVCGVLGIKDHKQTLGKLDPDERRGCPIPSPGGVQEAIAVSEAGVYRLIFRSTKPIAERFKRWLAHDVLPQVRRTGSYTLPQASAIEAPERTEEAEGTKVKLVTECRQTFGIPAAAQLWIKLGLPIVPGMLHDPRQAEMFHFVVMKTQG
jgi:prophage antirepressor-like protein